MKRINGDWGKWDKKNKKNRRRRDYMIVERYDEEGKNKVVVIEKGKDFRMKMIDYGVNMMDEEV